MVKRVRKRWMKGLMKVFSDGSDIEKMGNDRIVKSICGRVCG